MTPQHKPTTPTLADLTARLVTGAFITDTVEISDSGADVEPYEVTGGFQASSADLWREARQALTGLAKDPLAPPPEWSAFAALESGQTLTPFGAGLFPQRLRNFPSVLTAVANVTCRPTPKVGGLATLRTWAKKSLSSGDFAHLLTASGVSALLGDAADATQAIVAAERCCTPQQRAILENQKGVVAWFAGDLPKAKAIWNASIDATASQFNLGLAHLAEGRREEAQLMFRLAGASISETSGWCHMARLLSALTV